ncbi:MAG: hypothetical protein HRT80_13490 [Henriciella sp.]|nr:hypothetical protein [Henriciella sp.]
MTVKRLSTLTGTLLTAGVVASCGGGGEASPSDASEPSAAPASNQAESEAPESSAAAPRELDYSPITASGPSDALAQVNARAEIRRIVIMETGQDIDEVPLEASWPYGNCTDAASLIPPPLKGWRLFSMSAGEWPQGSDFARMSFSFIEENTSPGTAEYNDTKQDIAFYISSGTPSVDSMKEAYSNPQLTSMMLAPGPYNYPIQKAPKDYPGRAVLLGDYFVQIEGTGKDVDVYFAKVIECGIASGLVAGGVDLTTLRAEP